MERDDFLDFLSRAVDAGWLLAPEAREALRLFDAGLLTLSLLPLTLAEAFPVVNSAAARAALSARLSPHTGRPLVRIIESERARLTVSLLDSFDERAFSLARRMGRGEIGVVDWHEAMRDLIRDEYLTQAQLGAGRPLLPSELRRVEEAVDEQARYLHRFAEEVSAKALRAEDVMAEDAERMSERAVYDRARQYAGEGRAVFQEAAEARYGEGVVFRVNAVDDQGTCAPCSAADGKLFLAGQGFMPGRDCRARGKCRCTRTAVRDAEAYARLTGITRLAA